LLVLLPSLARADQPDLDGLWRRTRADGVTEYFEVFGQRRFTYRDSHGAAAAGVVTVSGGHLTLVARQGQRDFDWRAAAGRLTLTANADDLPVASTDLGRMSPVGLGQTAVYELPGAPPETLLTVDGPADLAGAWARGPAPEHADLLSFGPAGRFEWTGPGRLRAAGAVSLTHGGLLELSAGGLTRRLAPQLRLGPTGWSLTLVRPPGDTTPPTADLAELAPVFEPSARYTRPLAIAAPQDVSGAWQLRDAAGTVQSLNLAADGGLTYGRGPLTIASGRWELSGTHLELILNPTAVNEEHRFLRVQAVGGRLVLWRDETDPPPAPRATAVMPPLGEEVVRYGAGGAGA
jgi:hypothetical protein